MMLLRKQLLPLLRIASHLHRSLLLFSTSTSPATFSLEAYLATACNLAPDQVLKASKKAFKEASELSKKSKELSFSRLSSASNPDVVLALLSGAGLSRPEIAAILAADPLLLRGSVQDVAPLFAALRDRLGLSAPQISSLLLVASRSIFSSNTLPNLEFLIPFYGSFDNLLLALKTSYMVLHYDLEKLIKPNIALLGECGLSARDIVRLTKTVRWILMYNPERVKELVLRAEELGVPRCSGMFRQALAAVACASEEKLAAKMELLKSVLGCSDSELRVAVCRQPNIVMVSEEYLRRKSYFLINDIGMEGHYIVKRPVLLMLSLEKRLLPRHSVMKVLQAKGLLKNCAFYTFATLAEKSFKSRFLDCHRDIVPGLADAYAAARAGKLSSQLQI